MKQKYIGSVIPFYVLCVMRIAYRHEVKFNFIRFQEYQ